MEEQKNESKYAGLSKGQIKKLKEKEKKDREAAAAGGDGEATVEASLEEGKAAAADAGAKAAKGKKGKKGKAGGLSEAAKQRILD